MRGPLIIVSSFLLGAALYAVPRYDEMVGKREQVYKEWAQVETVLQRRYELIPNVLETARGFAGLETSVFKDVTDAYAGYRSASTVEDKVHASHQTERALRRLPGYVGRMYPQLSSSAHFLQLMSQLQKTEDLIADRRMKYNDAVSAYNVVAKTVAGRLVGLVAGLPPAVYYEPPSETQDAVVVSGHDGPHPSVAHSTRKAVGGGGATPGPGGAGAHASAVVAVQELKLVGVMRGGNADAALITGPDGVTHTLHRGGSVPGTSLRVVSIQDSSVTLESASGHERVQLTR